MYTIDIYTTPQCGFCKQLNSQLDAENKQYSTHDVAVSEQLLAEMQALTHGAMSVPVVVLDKGKDSQKVAVGFEEGVKLVGLTRTETNKTESELGTLTCPKCKHEQEAPIPTNACVPFYECGGCNQTIKAVGDDCCVFCSYGNKPCPVSNKGGSGCSDGSCLV